MKLYEISNEYRQAFEELSDMPDIDRTVINDTLSAIESSFNDKAISLSSFFMNLEAEAEAVKSAEKRMRERRITIEKKIDNLKRYLRREMLNTGINKITCPYFKVLLCKSKPKVEVIDPNAIPKEFIRKVITETIDKEKILKSGGCAGAEIVENYALRIS